MLKLDFKAATRRRQLLWYGLMVGWFTAMLILGIRKVQAAGRLELDSGLIIAGSGIVLLGLAALALSGFRSWRRQLRQEISNPGSTSAEPEKEPDDP